MIDFSDASEYFGVHVVESGDDPVVVVKGEVDLDAARPLWERITAALALRPTRLVIDMAETTFIDSSGLDVLLRAHAALGRMPEAVVLRAPSPAVRRVLHLGGIEEFFAYDDDGAPGAP